MNGLRSLEELRGRRGRERDATEGDVAREPPPCEEGAGFQTCDLPLLGQGVEGEYWDGPVLGVGGVEADGGGWQAVVMGEGSLSAASPFGGVGDGAGWA